MRVYRATLVIDLVAYGEDAQAALKTIEQIASASGLPYRIERFTLVRDMAELPAHLSANQRLAIQNLLESSHA